MRQNLGVGLGFEGVAFGGELFPELKVVLDYAVVNDNDLAGAIAVRMGVFFCRPPVGSPSGMSYAVNARERIGADDLFEVAELARCATYLEALCVREDSYSRRIISPVLQ